MGNPARIFYKDLSTNSAEQPLVQTPGNGQAFDGQIGPAISGNLVVWLQPAEYSFSPYQIHYMFLGGGCPGASGCDQLLSTPGAVPEYLSVSGHRIVWQDTRNGFGQSDIYMFDLDNPSLGAQPVVTTAGDDSIPSIDGDWITWGHYDNYNLGTPAIANIMAMNIVTGEVRQIATGGGSGNVPESPSISGTKISWWVNGPTGYYAMDDRVFVYDLATGQTQTIPGSDHALAVRINGNIVVWDSYLTNLVYMNNLATGITQPVSESGGTPVDSPDVSSSSGFIIWVDQRLGLNAIYENRIGDTAQTLADKYKPELKLAQNENFFPMPVEQFLTAPLTFLMKRNDPTFTPVENPTAQVLASDASIPDLYIDLYGNSISTGGGELSLFNPTISINYQLLQNDYVAPYQQRMGQFPATVYTRVVSRPAGNTSSFIQYWIFYYANDFPEDFHEGDWELIQIDLDGNLSPYRAVYSQHGNGQYRNWSGPGSVEKSPTDPNQVVTYVAKGSHANYFKPGDKYDVFPGSTIPILNLGFWDTALGNGDTLNDPSNPGPGKKTSATVIPEVDSSGGTPFAWLQFKGQWGEYTGANIGFYPEPQLGGYRDGPDNPPFQTSNYWQNAFAWGSCDGCQDATASQTDLEVTKHSPVDIRLYDSQGRVMAKNLGPNDVPIPNAEYLDYPELDRASIVVHGGNIDDGYRVEDDGNGTGAASITVTAPDHSGGSVDTLNYNNIQVNPSSKISMTLDSTRNYSAAIDVYGNGSDLIQKTPDTTTTNTVDFTPPAQISDLAVTATSSGTATLSFTAPGDDGNTGTATSYDLRYSTSAITDQYWNDATPAGNLPTPLPAGNTQEITVTGLNAGTTYYFAIKAMDKAGQFSPISNIPTAATTIPSLTWGVKRIYWASWDDYNNRQLSIDYSLGNSGTGFAKSPTIAASIASPTSVYATTTLPMTVSDLNPSTSETVTLKYFVPTTISRFTTTTYANCQDDAGRTYWFPGPLQ